MANAAMIQLWNEANAKRWLAVRSDVAGMIGPFGEAAMETLSPARGERALDVGCGCGDTTLELARRTGDALGVDISQPLIDVARSEAAHGARYLVADAQTHAFEEKFDVVFSRFGIMFFDDPGAAFRNLFGALRPGSRLAAAVWGPFEQNTWASVPLRLLREHLPGPSTPQPGPGPFGLCDPARGEALLKTAGFAQVSVRPVEIAHRTRPALLLQTGPVSAVLRDAGEAGERLRAGLEAQVAQALPDGIRAVALVLSAVRP